jgi:hypothetical protein
MPLFIAAGSAVLAALVTRSPGLGAVPPSGEGPVALSLLTTLCLLSGQALTYSDIVTELPIISREHRTGVGALVVTMSKWPVFAVVAVLQAALITVVFCLFPHRAPDRSLLFGPRWDLFIDLAGLSVAAMTLGLLVSTLARSLEQAVATVTAISIAQIAFNGVTSDLSQSHWLGAFAALLPDRWGLAAAASSTDLRGINPNTTREALWTHDFLHWFTALGGLATLTLLFFVLATWRLGCRLRPQRPSLLHRLTRR